METLYFNNWHIAELIGSGAFGSVYKIVREDFGEKYYAAMKLIDIPQSEDEIRALSAEGMSQADISDYYTGMAQEIVEEFKLMSKLKGHSNIVSYEDHMVLPKENGIGWTIQIRMELLTPLQEYVQKHDMSLRDVVALGIDICKALELCEKHHIIHRDVKPENIFLSENGDFKLGDFGVAKTMEKTMSNLSKKGTRAYMAPELARQELCTGNVDIYSLGLVMYRFLNHNRLPFLPKYPEKIKFSDREKAEFLRFSGADVPLPQKGGAELGNIVVKACAYSPEKRYQNPHELRADLEEIYKHIPEESIECKVENIPSLSGHYIATGEEERTINIFRTAVPSMKSCAEKSLTEQPGRISPMQEEIAEIQENIADTEEDTASEEDVRENEAKREDEMYAMDEAQEETYATDEAQEETYAMDEPQTEAIAEAPAASEAKTERKGKGRKLWILLLLALLAGAGIFYVYFMSSDNEMPDFIGMKEEQAAEFLKEKEIQYQVHQYYNDDFDKGKIYKQSPESGTEVNEDTKVVLYVSKGKDLRVEMPSLLNLKKSDAAESLDKINLKYTFKKKYSTKYKKGRVCKQSKKKGAKLKAGTTVTVWISKGQKPKKETANNLSPSGGGGSTQSNYVSVPSLTMYTRSEAIAKLRNQGLNYSVSYVSDGYPEDIVTGQSIGSGRSVQRGTTVTIYVDNGE